MFGKLDSLVKMRQIKGRGEILRGFVFRYAGITFSVAIQNYELSKPQPDHFRANPVPEATGIKIEAVIESRNHSISSIEIDQPPAVTLNNDTLTITHPLYEGTYNLSQDEGKVSVGSLFSLFAFIRLIVSVVIIDRGGLAIHSSCILQNNKAYIFAGSSGNGKSTVIKLTENPLLYSDEVTLVRKDETGLFWVYHSPFRSEFHTEPLHPLGKIAGIYFLRQDTAVFLESLSQADALIKLLPNIFFPVKARNPYEPKIFQLCCDFLCQVKAEVMHFKKDNSFWRCIDEEFGSLETEPGNDYQNN